MAIMIESVTLRVSQRGVPHTLVKIDGVTYSICFFGLSGMYRCWKNFGRDQVKCFDAMMTPGKEVDLTDTIKRYHDSSTINKIKV